MHVSTPRAPRKPPRYRPVTRHAFVFIVISFYSTLSYWSSAPRGTNCMQDFIFFAEIMKGIPFLFLLKINLVTMDSVRINFTIYVLKNVISKTRASTLKAGTWFYIYKRHILRHTAKYKPPGWLHGAARIPMQFKEIGLCTRHDTR